MFCLAVPNLPAGGVEVYSAGPDDMVDDGMDDDELLGTGSTGPSGSCNNGAGIIINRPLVIGEWIFVIDTVNDLVSPPVRVRQEAVAPLLSPFGIALLVALLSLVSVTMLRGRRTRKDGFEA